MLVTLKAKIMMFIKVKKVKRDGLSAVGIDKLMFACTVEECDRRQSLNRTSMWPLGVPNKSVTRIQIRIHLGPWIRIQRYKILLSLFS